MSHRTHKFINIAVLVIGILSAIVLPRFVHLGSYGYPGAFIAGILFVCSFTVAIGVVALAALARELNPVVLALIAGAGAVVGNFLIFRFIKDDILKEVEPLFKKFEGNHLKVLLHSKYFRWSLPVIGAILIVSPLPDEVGISLMDIAGMSTLRFLILTFCLNSLGIFLVALAATAYG
jgi:hypothetical protein